MIPLRYVNPEELLWLFRVADPFGFLKGRAFDFPSVANELIRDAQGSD